MITVTATELQNNFGEYLHLVKNGGEIIVMSYGKEVARLISTNRIATCLTDSLKGVLQNDINVKLDQAERMKKYENIG